jgi:hypothetical protein
LAFASTVTRHCHGDYIVLGDLGQWCILAGAKVFRFMYIVLLVHTISLAENQTAPDAT